MRILVVEDDNRVAAALQDALSQRGYDVARAATAAAALETCTGGRRIDLVLLDLGLPDLNGAQLAVRLREVTTAPVIVVTALGDVTSRVDLLRRGADDYVVKPFAIAELLARITAVLRRTRAGEAPPEEPIEIGDVRIDYGARIVTVAEEPVTLTRLEFDVLATLARAGGQVVARQRLLVEVWDTDWQGMERSLEVHVGNLRAKLDRPGLIETVRGIGYRLRR
jgi:DNA-binding response OmpR family regulator